MRCSFIFILIILTLCSNGQSVGIGTKTPNSSAALDIVNPKKGLLVPRVALLNITDNVTIPAPEKSLLVWNTTVDQNNFPEGPGFYYNNGTNAVPLWRKIATGGNPVIKRHECTIIQEGLSFTEPLLINKKIVEVVREGLGAPKILTQGQPNKNNVLYDKNTGTFKWAFNLGVTEEIYVIYQD